MQCFPLLHSNFVDRWDAMHLHCYVWGVRCFCILRITLELAETRPFRTNAQGPMVAGVSNRASVSSTIARPHSPALLPLLFLAPLPYSRSGLLQRLVPSMVLLHCANGSSLESLSWALLPCSSQSFGCVFLYQWVWRLCLTSPSEWVRIHWKNRPNFLRKLAHVIMESGNSTTCRRQETWEEPRVVKVEGHLW